MITLVETLPAGNALRLFLAPPAGVIYWRVLRKTSDTISGPSDPDAFVVVDHSTANVVLDRVGLTNGTAYFYADYGWTGSAWVQLSSSASGTPAYSIFDVSTDPQTVVRDRLDLGIQAEILAGNLLPASGKIAVTTAPFALADGVSFPTISVHMDSEAAADRALGEQIDPGGIGDDGRWQGTEGWYSRVSLNIVGVSNNPDERIALRLAIRRVMLGNLPVFDDAGLLQITLSQRDQEQFTENAAPLYLTVCTFDCIAPAMVASRVNVVSAVALTITTNQDVQSNG